jgi:carbon storage regulator CsrA
VKDKPTGNLVLTRGEGQAIHIGPDITVTVVWSRHGQAQLAIEAPKSVKIRRDEHGKPNAEGKNHE